MAPSLCPSSVLDTPYLHCSGLYTVGDLLKHVKSVHPFASRVYEASQVVFFCKCPPLLCFSLILFILLLQVGFKPNLAPLKDYLNLILCVLVSFIKSFEPSRS
jgi:hypothetical protein